MADTMTLSGLAVVTGGSSGIGAACATGLAARGASIAILDIDPAGRDLATALGGRFWECDVGDAEAVEKVAHAIETTQGPAEYLVNSAGILQKSPAPPHRYPIDAWDEIVRVDQRGTYLTCRAFGLRMVARGRGAIVNIASVAGMMSTPLHSYTPAKAAVIAMTECLAAEWGRAQIRVNTVSPGVTRTPALDAALKRGDRDISTLRQVAPLGRLVEPGQIAAAVAFLLSSDAAAITGVNLPVDCGWLISDGWHFYGGLRDERQAGATTPPVRD
jgi:NAD(P)-dependent dehydrogenase (short-subunit alcohol dehydrogenase family)